MTMSPLFQSASDIDPVVLHDNYDDANLITLHQGDTRTFLQAIPDSTISLVVTSPPYNTGKSYEQKREIVVRTDGVKPKDLKIAEAKQNYLFDVPVDQKK